MAASANVREVLPLYELEKTREGHVMRSLKAKAAVATTTAIAGAIAASVAIPSQASVREFIQLTVPNSQNETIYRPTCWTDDGYERWLRCAVRPGGAEQIHPHFKGGHYGRSRGY
jgi:hypothetical protein